MKRRLQPNDRKLRVLMAILLLSCLYPSALAAPKRPNVLLILTDDQGYGDLGFHGNTQIQTPNLDRFARESVRLTRFYVSPVCTPTRASLMTGRYNFRTGAIDTFMGRAMLHPAEVTLPQMLAGAGYRTGIFGKWHLGDCYPLRPKDRGFQESLVHKGGGIGQPSDPPGGDHYLNPTLYHNGKPEKQTGYCSDVYTDAAIRFIEENRNRPFFAYLAFNAPHVPLEIDEKYVAPYRAKGLDETTARVYGMVQNIDENVGRLFAKLHDLGIEKNTIVIFMTDNGPQQKRFNAGLRGLKGSVYEGGIHVPCFVRWPAQWKGGRDASVLAAHNDIAPTLLAACNVRPPADVKMDGQDLGLWLGGHEIAGYNRILFFQWHRGDTPELYDNCAVRFGQFKLVNGKELYDIDADPAEARDLASGQPDRVSRMRAQYEAWFKDVCGTRGFDPVNIVVGSDHERATWLTRQDWRDTGKGEPGRWHIDLPRSGTYEFTLFFENKVAPKDIRLEIIGTLEVDWKTSHGNLPFRASTQITIYHKGQYGVRAWAENNGVKVAATHVVVRLVPEHIRRTGSGYVRP